MYGKVYEGIIRSMFLIDEAGFLLEVWYKIHPEKSSQLVKEFLR